MIYEHLTRMSFPFYDRVQSGQLISRANSDIRSVQMYMTFAPLILVQCSIAVVAFGFMLSINVRARLHRDGDDAPRVPRRGMRMRKSMFPVSWLIQSRLADVATIVDENVNGVRVVKSFAAEPYQLGALAKAADKLQWAYVKDADLRAKWTPTLQNLPQAGLALVLLFGGYMVIHGQLGVGAILAFNAYLLDAAGTVHDARDAHHDGPARRGFGRAPLRDPRRAAHDRRSPRCDRPRRLPRGRAFRVRRLRVRRERPTACSRASTFTCGPGETVALVGRTGGGQVDRRPPSRPLLRRDSGAVLVDGHDVRDLTLASLRANVGMVLDEPFLFSSSIRDNIAYGRPDATMAEIEAAAEAAGADEFIARPSRGLRRGRRRARLHACRVASASGSPSPAPCS